MDDLLLTDELGSEFGRSAPLAARAAQHEVLPQFSTMISSHRAAVGARDLADRLKAEDASPAELAQARERILEPVDLPECVQLVDDKPQALVPLVPAHGLEDRDPHPRGDDRAERCDLAGLVGKEQHAALSSGTPRRTKSHPLADGEGRPFLAGGVLEHPRAYRSVPDNSSAVRRPRPPGVTSRAVIRRWA